ncbi:MAG: AP-3 complex subunit beta [Tremellales sp. Tagirdzhanova-0007]|nr:MAG: AP-3 complex subunit beta [Tremellales sp. Tagirdzhanova-0007]
MAALNRLQQRIKENFQETTRDIALLSGGSGTSNAAYFDTSDEKVKEISKLLESRVDRERLEGMKRIIAGISKGRDMESFFAQVVKNVVAPSIEIRKLVYIYLLRFSSTNSDLLLLSINTFQKDLTDSSPLIRSMSLRVLTSIRVPVIQGIVMLGLKRLVTDRNPWVRKTVAGGLTKVYEMDPSSMPQLLPLLQTLLASPSPLTLGATLTAFTEIYSDRLDLLHPYYRHICRLLVDADEWGQIVALGVLTRYARMMLEKPESDVSRLANAEESEDEFAGIDLDLAIFLDCARPLFQSRNAAVVLGTANAFYHLAPVEHASIGQKLLVAPLLRLAGAAETPEIAVLTWDVIASIVEERPRLFASEHSDFFVHASDTVPVKLLKIKAMIALVSPESASASVREFKHYVRSSENQVSEEAVRAIGYCVRAQPSVAAAGLSALMRLLRSRRDTLVAQAVIVLKSVILSRASSSSSALPDPQRLVARLARQLDGITNPQARASVFWLVGQFAASDGSGDGLIGLGWQGVVSWVPDVLRKGVKAFVDESLLAKLQILTLATKLLVLAPTEPQLLVISQYLSTLARYDADYDVRDRSRFLHSLLRGVHAEGHGSVSDQVEEDTDVGGVVLRREQAVDGSSGKFDIGTLSRITHKRLNGYDPLPDWTDDPTDASLRESQVENAKTVTPTAATPLIPAPVPQSSSTASLPRSATALETSKPVSAPIARGKFQDLDAFLNSDSEEDDESGDDSGDSEAAPVPVRAPPRSAIVPEYDQETTSDDEVEETGDESEDEQGDQAPLYGQYR